MAILQAKQKYQANQAIISYIEGELAADPEKKFVILGDFNAELDKQEMLLWEDESVPASIVTESIEKADGYSYPGRKTLIDHIITVNEGVESVLIPKPLFEIVDYERHISDHLPVIGISQYND